MGIEAGWGELIRAVPDSVFVILLVIGSRGGWVYGRFYDDVKRERDILLALHLRNKAITQAKERVEEIVNVSENKPPGLAGLL